MYTVLTEIDKLLKIRDRIDTRIQNEAFMRPNEYKFLIDLLYDLDEYIEELRT